MFPRGSRTLLCVFAVALLLPSAAAAAKTKVYGGKADIGGKIAFDVKVKRKKPKEIEEIRFVGIPATCEKSGPGVPLNGRIPAGLKVDRKGEFEFKLTDDYGNKNSIKGRFS